MSAHPINFRTSFPHSMKLQIDGHFTISTLAVMFIPIPKLANNYALRIKLQQERLKPQCIPLNPRLKNRCRRFSLLRVGQYLMRRGT